MTRARRAGLGWWWTVVLVGCALPAAVVKKGSGYQPPPLTVVLLPAVCQSEEYMCEDAHVDGPTTIVGGQLGAVGFTVVKAEDLVLAAKDKDDAPPELRGLAERMAQAKSRRQLGASFEDLSQEERGALLKAGEAVGVVEVRVTVGALADDGVTRPANQVRIRLVVRDDAELAWQSTCDRESSESRTVDDALDRSAKCAVAGVAPGRKKK